MMSLKALREDDATLNLLNLFVHFLDIMKPSEDLWGLMD